jgi:hypothetical protein
MLEQILCIFDICTLCHDTVCSSFDNFPTPSAAPFPWPLSCFCKWQEACDCFKNDPASHRFPDIEGQRRETIETEIVRQNDTEAGELVQNQGEMTCWIIFETITGVLPLAKATQYRQKYFIGGKTNYLM